MGNKACWDGLEDEITNCIKCGKKIWIKWKSGQEEMDKCANCFFKRVSIRGSLA